MLKKAKPESMAMPLPCDEDVDLEEHGAYKNISPLSGCRPGQAITPECEVMFENDVDNLDKRYKHCSKHPGHPNFIPVPKFSVDHLPPRHRTQQMMDDIFRRCVLTVRVKVYYTSEHRPDKFADNLAPYPFTEFKGNSRVVRYGTGSIVEVFYYHPIKGKPCPCPICKKSGQPKMTFWWIRVRTSTHVVFDKSEAVCSEFDCFYDTNDRNGVKTIYGFDSFNIMMGSDKKFVNDVCDMMCVTHDHETVAIFNTILPANNFLRPPIATSACHAPSRVIVSHPHGCSKRITVGEILHLTVPIGPDYPVNTPIPFKTGTFCRKTLTSTDDDTVDDDKARQNELKDLRGYNFKEKLDGVKASLKALESDLNDINIVTDLVCSSTAFDTDDLREKYISEFYFLFLREHCLKILVMCAILDQKNKNNDMHFEHQVKAAFEEVFRTFLNREYPASDIGMDLVTQKSYLHYWVNLIIESENDFMKFLSNEKVTSHPSIIVSWFDQLGKIVDSVILARKSEQKQINEDILPELTERGLKTGVKILMHHEEIISQRKNAESQDNFEKQEEAIGRNDGGNEYKNGEECKSDGNGLEDYGMNLKKDEEEDENIETVLDGSTFTLPSDAEYVFRIYSNKPGWITFVPGTVMTMPDGTKKDIGENSFEFIHPNVRPEQSYVTYDINTCPGSSGANVYCEMLGKYLGTYFPHSGNQKLGINRSGIRNNLFTLYNKMFLYSPANVFKSGDRGPLRLIEGTKSLFMRLNEILKKS